MKTQQVLRCSLIVVGALVLLYLLNQYNQRSQMEEYENFAVAGTSEASSQPAPVAHPDVQPDAPQEPAPQKAAPAVAPEAALPSSNSKPAQVSAGTPSPLQQQGALPQECFPKNQLSPAELLPADANSKWAQVNPAGQGSVGDQNFLNAGFHVGVNTVGQSLRNANRQLRSDPPNPTTKVSPWMQTTIEPDVNRRPLEIGA